MSNLSDFLPPPVSFYFNVVFMNVPLVGDMSFQEVSGLGAEMVTEELREGGENSFSYQLPTRIKHSNLVMKRPIAPNLLDPLAFWFSMSLGGGVGYFGCNGRLVCLSDGCAWVADALLVRK